ncbi:MAG: hypothetical protein IH840_05245 [Candidatus Heimdallarchaeota archaeon]|nr:hypothetical protein [Candidatus Heimdallarchaeota archaeon]
MARKKNPLNYSIGIGLDAEMIEKLEVIQENEFLDSKTQVIRKALRFYLIL